MAENIIQVQYPQQQQRVPAMPLTQAKPLVAQGIPIEYQQRPQQNQYVPGQYYYGRQPQPVMGIMYNPTPWYQHQDQLQQLYLQNQFWYGIPYVNGPQGFRPKPPSNNPPIIPPNGKNSTQTGHTFRPLKPSIKTRSRPILKNHTQSSSIHGQTSSGCGLFDTQKTSADCCLSRIRSISSVQNNKGSPTQDAEQCTDGNQLKEAVSKELAIPKEKIHQKNKNEEEPVKEVVKEEIHMEKVEEPSLFNESSGLFRRLARFMRFRSAGKSKNRKKKNGFKSIVTQAYS